MTVKSGNRLDLITENVSLCWYVYMRTCVRIWKGNGSVITFKQKFNFSILSAHTSHIGIPTNPTDSPQKMQIEVVNSWFILKEMQLNV